METTHLHIAADLNQLATLRTFIRDYCAAMQLAGEITEDVVLAVDEAVTNSITHGYAGQAGDIYASLTVSADRLVVCLRDNAAPFDPTQLPQPDLSLPLEQRPLGGMGVYLMLDLMDEVRHAVTETGGNELILTKYLVEMQEQSFMDITVEQAAGTSVTIMRLMGELDGSNFQDVIEHGKQIYADGGRDLLLDMQQVPFMSSAGLVALHSLALIMRGDQPPDPEAGWSAFHALSAEAGNLQTHVKLLGPPPSVDRVLTKTGLKNFFAIFADEAEAVASF